MEGLCRAVGSGEHCLPWLDFQAALKECEVGSGGVQGAEGRVKVELENRGLWKQFDEITNEMIITKAGR